MNSIPKGKIGRLPKAVQEQVNRRLEQGERGRPLASWLNSLPEVQAVLTAQFAGRPIREQNLSEWRQYGYATWARQQEAKALMQQMRGEDAQLQLSGAKPSTDEMTEWVTVRYLLAVRKLVENNAATESGLKVLREFSHDFVALRRAANIAARLKMEQERLERVRKKTNNPEPASSPRAL